MKLPNVWQILLCASTLIFLISNTNGGDLVSSSTWQHLLEEAHSSGISASTFSSDNVLNIAGAELDRDLNALRRRIELSTLVAQMRQHEKGYVSQYFKESIHYSIHIDVPLAQEELAKAMKEHFKSAHRNFALLNDETIITSLVNRKGGTSASDLWGLDESDSYVFFWDANPQRTRVAFKGVAVVSPPAVIRHIFNQLPALVPAKDQKWDYTKLVFRAPNQLELLVPLIPR